jgi:hypothetical protein
MNRTAKSSNSSRRPAKRKSTARKGTAHVNSWMRANYDELLEKAKRNCIELTGKPTFGATRARKSA